MTRGRGSLARCGREFGPAKRMFPEKGCGARKPEALEFWVATWRASKNQWGGNHPWSGPWTTTMIILCTNAFPWLTHKQDGGREKQGAHSWWGRTDNKAGTAKGPGNWIHQRYWYKRIYKMSLHKLSRAQFKQQGDSPQKVPAERQHGDSSTKLDCLLFRTPEGRMRERAQGLKISQGVQSWGQRSSELCCSGRKLLR